MMADDKDAVINQDSFVAGQNEIVVIGNDLMTEGVYKTTEFQKELHPGEEEYSDIYIGADKLHLPLNNNHRIWLYRTKGLLLIRFVNLPDDISQIDVTAGGVYSTVGRNFDYSGTTQVRKSFDISPNADPSFRVMLAPSASAGGTNIELKLTDGVNNGMAISNIQVDIIRNKITVIQPAYNPETNEWSLSVLVDGVWQQIENLHIV